ncbi:hypothetical protein NL676_031981 [Syzygium grande]|nr:hypothetical protein NL676_031981 [Syzygium grande]
MSLVTLTMITSRFGDRARHALVQLLVRDGDFGHGAFSPVGLGRRSPYCLCGFVVLEHISFRPILSVNHGPALTVVTLSFSF